MENSFAGFGEDSYFILVLWFSFTLNMCFVCQEWLERYLFQLVCFADFYIDLTFDNSVDVSYELLSFKIFFSDIKKLFLEEEVRRLRSKIMCYQKV